VLGTLQRFRNHLNNFALISALPAEILLAIFQHCQQTGVGETLTPTWSRVVQPVIDLTHVCRRWRQIALDHPSLWTTICAKDHNELWALPEILRRSGDLPLDVSVEWRRHTSHRLRASTTVSLDQHIRHIRSFQLNIREEPLGDWKRALRSPAPLLQKFELVRSAGLPETAVGGVTNYNLFGGHAPNLQKVHFENIPLDVLDSSVFRSVTELAVLLYTVSPQDVRAILASCPLVQTLTLSGAPSPSTLARVPQPRRGGLWPAPNLITLSLSNIDPRATDLILPHLPILQMKFVDISYSDDDIFSTFELLPATTELLLKSESPPKHVMLQGKIFGYPPRVSWDVIVLDEENRTRAVAIPRLARHSALLLAITRTPTLSIPLDVWSPFVDTLPTDATLDIHKLILTIESVKAADHSALDGCRAVLMPGLRRIVIKSKTSQTLPRLPVLHLLNSIVQLRGLRHGRLKKVALKGVRPSDALEDLKAIAQQIDIQEQVD